MTIDPANAGAPGLVDRAKNILLQPQKEFDQIAGEPVDVNQLYIGYVLPLAALAAICGFIGTSLVGVMGFKIGLVPGLIGAVIQVAMALVGVFILAFVTNMLAPNFGSQQDMGQAHKLAAYSSTAGFLAGVFTILPLLAILSLVGLYSIALLYIGLPRLMKTPEDKRVTYLVVIIVVCIVLGIVLGTVMGAVRGMIPGYSQPGYTFGQNGPTARDEVTLPGGGGVDVAELQRQAEAMQGGSGTTVDPARVQAQLPQSLPGGFSLTSSSSSSVMGVSQAEGVYTSGEAQLRLTVVQTGAMSSLASVAAGMNVQENRQDGDGYARTQTIDGRIYSEEVNSGSSSASYGIIGRGVAVTAEGTNITLDQARAAVETVGVRRLEREFGA